MGGPFKCLPYRSCFRPVSCLKGAANSTLRHDRKIPVLCRDHGPAGFAQASPWAWDGRSIREEVDHGLRGGELHPEWMGWCLILDAE